MSAPDIASLRARIVAACEAARAKGARIVADRSPEFNDAALSPFDALSLAERGRRAQRYTGDVAAWLAVRVEWVNGFSSGFYGRPLNHDEQEDPDAYALGRELRARYIDGAAP